MRLANSMNSTLSLPSRNLDLLEKLKSSSGIKSGCLKLPTEGAVSNGDETEIDFTRAYLADRKELTMSSYQPLRVVLVVEVQEV